MACWSKTLEQLVYGVGGACDWRRREGGGGKAVSRWSGEGIGVLNEVAQMRRGLM